MNLRKILVLSATFILAFASAAFAQEHAAAAGGTVNWAMPLAAAVAIGIAAAGGALGQAKTAVAALEGIARNPAAQPKIFIPMIIGLALIESLVLYAFVIAFRILG